MAGFRIEGDLSGHVAEVDDQKNLRVRLPAEAALAGAMRLIGREDEQLRVTGTGYLMASIENLEFIDTIEGNVVNGHLWTQSSSGMTISQVDGALTLNANANKVAGSYAIVRSIQQFTNANTNPLYMRWAMQSVYGYTLEAGAVLEVGWGQAEGVSAPSDGVLLRFTNGKARLVINNLGTETTTEFAVPGGVAKTDEFWMYIYGTRVKLYKNNERLLDVPLPETYMAMTGSNRQPVFLRAYNTQNVTTAPSLRLGQMTVQNLNSPFNKTHAHRLVGMGKGAIQGVAAPFSQTANSVNNAAPTLANLSNVNAGYLTLGGQFQFAAVAGSETDYALFAYRVPDGYQLYVTDLDISTWVVGASVNNQTPTVLQWGIGVNGSGVSLATADGPNSWAPRRRSMGAQNFPTSSPVGFMPVPIERSLETPIVIEGGRYLHIILKIPTGAPTPSQLFRGNVGIHGYFE